MSAWDEAMTAISEHGCDCEDAPEHLHEHTCIAGRCEYALVREREYVRTLGAAIAALRRRVRELEADRAE